MAHNKSSKKWLQEHFSDKFVKKAKQKGWRSRAIYKLEEINQKDQLLKNTNIIIDLGAAPGSWSQWLSNNTQENAKIFSLDILEMESYHKVKFIKGDFTEKSVLKILLQELNNKPVDLIVSDMAPNFSGFKSVDIPKSIYLIELAIDLVDKVLKSGGNFCCKAFQGEGVDKIFQQLHQRFHIVRTRKPKASRDKSKEIYIVCKNKK